MLINRVPIIVQVTHSIEELNVISVLIMPVSVVPRDCM